MGFVPAKRGDVPAGEGRLREQELIEARAHTVAGRIVKGYIARRDTDSGADGWLHDRIAAAVEAAERRAKVPA